MSPTCGWRCGVGCDEGGGAVVFHRDLIGRCSSAEVRKCAAGPLNATCMSGSNVGVGQCAGVHVWFCRFRPANIIGR